MILWLFAAAGGFGGATSFPLLRERSSIYLCFDEPARFPFFQLENYLEEISHCQHHQRRCLVGFDSEKPMSAVRGSENVAKRATVGLNCDKFVNYW